MQTLKSILSAVVLLPALIAVTSITFLVATASRGNAQMLESNSPSEFLWTRDDAYMVNNNQYALTGEQSQQMLMMSKNAWGGSWDLKGLPGATYPSIVYGQWPWTPDVTANSGMPVQVKYAGDYLMNWAFTSIIPEGEIYNAPIELWLHNQSNIRQGYGFDINVTCDIMIEPNTNSESGVLIDQVTYDGVRYDVWLQTPDHIELFYPIVHFKRVKRANRTGELRLNHFWDYCIAQGWASEDDWISSINAGLEPLSYDGQPGTIGSFWTHRFYVQRERYECERMDHTGEGQAWESHDTPATDASGESLHTIGADSVGDFVEFDVYIFKPGDYEISTRMHRGPTRGRFKLSIDDVDHGNVFDGYRRNEVFALVEHDGTVNLSRGMHRFRYTVIRKHQQSSGYEGAFDYIRLKRL